MLTTAEIADSPDDVLVLAWAGAQELARSSRDQMDRIAFELQRRMETRGATALPDPYFDVRLETPRSLDPQRLAPLAERIPPEEWARGYTPAHEETVQVPARADLRVVNGWRKYGVEISEAIDAAVVPGPAKITIKPRRA